MNWQVNFNDVFKKYKRFLKDCGCYSKAIAIHKNGCGSNINCKTSLKDRVLRLTTPRKIISDVTSFCLWRDTPDGELFWWDISNKWQIRCLLEDIGGTHNKTDSMAVVRGIKHFLKVNLIVGEPLKYYSSMIVKIKEKYNIDF